MLKDQEEIFSQKKPNILIVDDIPENLFLLGKTLQKEGYDISYASNGEQAINISKKLRPDLILLDILMPNMNGYEVCKIIKEDNETSDIPIIFLTALSDSSQVLEGFKVGASDYISKPFNIPEVIARIKTHLDLKLSRDMNINYINKLKAYNQELNEAEKKLIELNNSKDKFFSIVAHDLKNPFHGFMRLTEVMLVDFDELSKEEIKSYLLEIHSSAEKLYKLLENLLTWSRVQIGQIPYEPELIELHDLFDSAILLYKENAKSKKIKIQNKLIKGEKVFADKNMLDAVIRNLLSNAIKFTNIEGNIDIYSENENIDNMLKIVIQDDGIGIKSEDLAKIFRLDYQIIRNGTANEKGTGLGLLLSKELIEKNYGKLELESIEGLGTRSIIYLPKNPV
ncbi:MAG: hybrid sensor histidine kinase/response regulator [Candidatus Kapabacteria bacterium]|nr:hybrid sensor histidine kinase/response regulator [Candidatus Kapabacteria bacterium]